MAETTDRPQASRWTLKGLLKGDLIGHPSHPMTVHFPVAFYIATLVFDVMSKIEPNPALVLAGSYLLVGAFIATGAAVVTGLVDWFDMVRGSTKRRRATQHMVVQVIAAAFFVVMFLLRWGDRTAAEAETAWIVLGAVGLVVIGIGYYLGGKLVYGYAMRVKTGGTPD